MPNSPRPGTATRSFRAPDTLWAQVKARAVRDGITPSDVVKEALEAHLMTTADPQPVPPDTIEMDSFPGGTDDAKLTAAMVRFAPVFHDESLTFEERRDQLVTILRQSSWFKSRDGRVSHSIPTLHDIADGLANAEDVEQFDVWQDALDDKAEHDRVRIIYIYTDTEPS